MEPDDLKRSVVRAKLALPLSAVKLHALDLRGNEVKDAYATGFICREPDGLYLYTCWHVATGYGSPWNVKTGKEPSTRRSLRVEVQSYTEPDPGIFIVRGRRTFTVPLYSDDGSSLWLQDEQSIENFALECIGIKVPAYFDVIKIKLAPDAPVAPAHIVNRGMLRHPYIGDKLYIAGFPHGYSATGLTQPTAVVLTRHVASSAIGANVHRFLADGPAAPGMSGSPVFLEAEGYGLQLMGIYAGVINPGATVVNHHEYAAALAECYNLSMFWSSYWPEAISPSTNADPSD